MTNTLLPPLLRETLIDLGTDAVDRWWETLSESERSSVIELWRSDSLSPASPARVVIEPMDGDQPDLEARLWHDDFYDYLVNHEVYILREQPFHICTQHPQAKAAIQAGTVPADYACPWERQDCPMRSLTALFPGAALRLRLSFSPPETPKPSGDRLVRPASP